MNLLFKIKIEGEWHVIDWCELNQTILFGNDLSNHVVLSCSGVKDCEGNWVFDGDIISLQDENMENIQVICRYGLARRKMDSGLTVDIPSFYFEKIDGAKTYPIVKNYLGRHDLELFKIVGNVY